MAGTSVLGSASAEFERAVRQLPANAWDRPTPADVTVCELVEHVVAGNRFAALLLKGRDPAQARAALAGGQLGSDPLAAVVESARGQAAAFVATPPSRLLPHPGGDIPAAAFLRFRLVDLVVHAWDLRRGSHIDETLDRAVVEEVWRLVEPHLAAMLRFGAYGDGPSGRLPAAASPQTRLLDAFGRRP